jgi:hypothetical protein
MFLFASSMDEVSVTCCMAIGYMAFADYCFYLSFYKYCCTFC